VPARLFLLLLLGFAPLAHADLQWASTTVFSTALPSEAKVYAEFTFTNTGTYAIKVIGTRTTCGCTAAIADEHTIAPGQTGKVEVAFKILGRRGLYEEPIVVDTNDPNAKESTLYLRALIRNAVDILPTLLFWQPGEPLDPKVITITTADGFTVKNLDVSCSNPAVAFRLDTVKAGADYKLFVTPKSSHLKAAIRVTPDIDGQPPRAITALVRVS
jgi:hypothetical protein